MAASLHDVTDMLVFARVVEEKSFTAAGRALGLSKSLVSARVLRLEERLGERLLHRTTRRLALTDAGMRFYDRCARVAAEADEAAGVAEGVAGARRWRRSSRAGPTCASSSRSATGAWTSSASASTSPSAWRRGSPTPA
jgi:DNA-binding transcriptional LysR family regulator